MLQAQAKPPSGRRTRRSYPMCVSTNFDRTVRRHLLHRGAKFDIESLEFRSNSGRSIRRECIRHQGSVILLPLLEDGRIVMIKNWRLSTESWLWELPAGTMSPGEAPITCAARELTEETGFVASSLVPLQGLPWFYAAPGLTDERMHAFVATGLSPVPQALEEDERIETHSMPRAHLNHLIASGEVVDAKTLLVLFAWDRAFNAAP